MSSVLSALNGYKTYIAAGALTVVAAVQYTNGDTVAAMKTLGEAAAIAGLRNAIPK